MVLFTSTIVKTLFSIEYVGINVKLHLLIHIASLTYILIATITTTTQSSRHQFPIVIMLKVVIVAQCTMFMDSSISVQ